MLICIFDTVPTEFITTFYMPAKKTDAKAVKYPPLYFVGDIPVRLYNQLTIYLNEPAMNKVAEIAKANPGLSCRKIIAISSKPCECCVGTVIEVTHNGKTVRIPRGLLPIPKNSQGKTASNKKKKKQ